MTDNAQSDSPPLRMLFWESTAMCNLACVHCRRLDERDVDRMSTAEARKMIDSAGRLGRPVLVFSGGEPLLREDLLELAEYAGSRNLPTALATNGTLIDRARGEELTAAGFRRAAVSIDGADASTHDAFRGLDGAFTSAIRGIDHLQAAGLPTQINVTVTTRNVNQLDALYEFADVKDLAGMHLFMLVPVGCGMSLSTDQQISSGQYEKVLNWIIDRQGQGDLELRATCGPHYYRIARQRGVSTGPARGCLCGRSVIFVSHRGEVQPCGYLPLSCGSIRRTPLEEIWNDGEILRKLRDDEQLQGACGCCEYKTICGGCRARAYAETGNYLGPEPRCAFSGRGNLAGAKGISRRAYPKSESDTPKSIP